MKRYNTSVPVGNKDFCDYVSRVQARAQAYKRGGVRPAHLIVELDSGEGRTTLARYMADVYGKAGVFNPDSCLEDCVEVTFGDGTPTRVREAFAIIDSEAVYSNSYTGVVAMDISGMATRLNETQLDEFLSGVRRVCEHAPTVFFIHSEPGRNEERLVEKLCEAVGNTKRIPFVSYTSGELAEIILRDITERGIEVSERSEVASVIESLLESLCIGTVKDALPIADELVLVADYSDTIPVLDENAVASAKNNIANERSETI